jgi:hypothetical protein
MSRQLIKNKIINILLMVMLISSCSTKGGFYDSSDPEHDEFSIVNSVLSIGAAAAVVIGVANGVGGNSYSNSYGYNSYAWDYQPGNNTWVCRNRSNGQYSLYSNCAGMARVDSWR